MNCSLSKVAGLISAAIALVYSESISCLEGPAWFTAPRSHLSSCATAVV